MEKSFDIEKVEWTSKCNFNTNEMFAARVGRQLLLGGWTGWKVGFGNKGRLGSKLIWKLFCESEGLESLMVWRDSISDFSI